MVLLLKRRNFIIRSGFLTDLTDNFKMFSAVHFLRVIASPINRYVAKNTFSSNVVSNARVAVVMQFIHFDFIIFDHLYTYYRSPSSSSVLLTQLWLDYLPAWK